MVASPWKWQFPMRETCATPSTGWPKTFGSEVGTRANVFPVVTRMAAAFTGGPSSAPSGERLMTSAADASVMPRARSSVFIDFLSFWDSAPTAGDRLGQGLGELIGFLVSNYPYV